MFCGTGSPIVSGASAGAFAKPKSFTFSLIIKRCSWVRLIVRGWGAIAGLVGFSWGHTQRASHGLPRDGGTW